MPFLFFNCNFKFGVRDSEVNAELKAEVEDLWAGMLSCWVSRSPDLFEPSGGPYISEWVYDLPFEYNEGQNLDI